MNFTEQAVVNHKFYAISKLKDGARGSEVKNLMLSDLERD